MTRRLLLSGALVWIIGLVNGFNLSPEYAQVFEDPQNQTQSYFGYSIALQKHNRPGTFWMVVGAPRANSSAETQRNVIEPGVVYRCTTDAHKPGCQPVPLVEPGNERLNNRYGKLSEFKNHSWTGAAIDVTDQGGLLVCAPKWINPIYTDIHLVNGICYWKESTGSDEFAFKMKPLEPRDYQGYKPNPNLNQTRYFYSFGQAGFSAHVTADGKEFLLGAPGVLEWIGSVILAREYTPTIDIPSNRRRRQTVDSYFKFVIPNPYDESKLYDSGLFGYAVSSGNFLSPNKLSYVASSPREEKLKGSVSVYEYNEITISIKVQIYLEGTQFGEYFGASIGVVDLNNDKLDDLLVGAPLHSVLGEQGNRFKSGDEGRVYVFINNGRGLMKEIGDTHKIMGMQARGARFGSCVSNVGDLNKDGFNDFAVGAPYENEGRGVIYIYHGQMTGFNPKYKQRITARDIHPALAGFGYSISKGVDIDNNSYNDIAVGAFNSDHAVLIRSRPVVKFNSRLGENVKEVNINASGFAVEACLRYQGKNLPPTVDVLISISVSSKSKVKSLIQSESDTEPGNSSHSYFATLQFNKYFCKTVNVTLMKGTGLQENDIDYTKPFELNMSYLIDERKMRPPKLPNTNHEGDTFCKNCPVVDPNDMASITKDVLYATGCKTLICQTDLAVTASFEENVRTPHKIGTLSKARMKIVVDNYGEAAFLAKLNVLIPRSTPIVRIPSRCQDFDTDEGIRLECDIGNPLRSNSQAQIDLELSFKDFGPRVESLSYEFSATSSGSEVNPENNAQVLALALEAEADMEIVGVSTQNEFVYLPENSQTFIHMYEVINHGPSPASAVRLEFDIPVAYETADEVISFVEVYKPTVTLDSQGFSCTPENGKAFSELKEKFSEESDFPDHRATRSTAMGVDTANLSMNTTFFLDCSNLTNVVCMTVTCDPVGPFHVINSRALLSFKMKANLTKLASVLNIKDTIAVSSRGAVSISPMLLEKQPIGNGARSDYAVVVTMFYGSIINQPFGAWIWIVAILGGILLLLIIAAVLYKVGFFKRKEKEDLEHLKEEENHQPGESAVPENEINGQEDEQL